MSPRRRGKGWQRWMCTFPGCDRPAGQGSYSDRCVEHRNVAPPPSKHAKGRRR